MEALGAFRVEQKKNQSSHLSSAPLFFKRESHRVWGLSRQLGLSERDAERGAKLALKAKKPSKLADACQSEVCGRPKAHKNTGTALNTTV
jgi:hypothetical protein